jgi:hypothetical protein
MNIYIVDKILVCSMYLIWDSLSIEFIIKLINRIFGKDRESFVERICVADV